MKIVREVGVVNDNDLSAERRKTRLTASQISGNSVESFSMNREGFAKNRLKKRIVFNCFLPLFGSQPPNRRPIGNSVFSHITTFFFF